MNGIKMYLLDTNILLELMLEQPNAETVERFMRTMSSDQLFITDFAIYSIGIRLFRIGRHSLYLQLLNDLFVINDANLVKLETNEMQASATAAQQFKLDFDDAYQYAAAEKYNLTLVSFDAHFDTTPRGRKTPADLLTSS